MGRRILTPLVVAAIGCGDAEEPTADGTTGSAGTEVSSGGTAVPTSGSMSGSTSPGTGQPATSSDAESTGTAESTGEDPPPPACRTTNETIVALPAGTWLEVDARLEEVLPPTEQLEEVWGNSGPASIMSAWCGAAFDTVRDRLIATGGGHWDYAGNELYAFDLGTLEWERLTDPSSFDGWTSGDDVMPDGLPPSRHTYNGILYLPPPIDRLWINGGSVYGPGPNSPRTWLYDFDAELWTEAATAPISAEVSAAYDAERDRVYASWNYWGVGYHTVDADAWTMLLGEAAISTLYRSAAYDPARQLVLYVGNGDTMACDVANDAAAACNVVATSGPAAMEITPTPGFTYDPAREQFVGWDGGSAVYVLDPDTMTWTEQIGAGPTPTARASNGTFSRWQYSECHDVFVGVNAIDEPVYIYRLQS